MRLFNENVSKAKDLQKHKIILMKKSLLLIFTISVIFLSGCISQKEIAYFKGIKPDSAAIINQFYHSKQETKICNGDALLITVSALDPNAVAPFNLPLVMYATPGSDKIYSSPTMQYYIVDVNGKINFPVLGSLKLSGLTKSEAIELINNKLTPFLKDPIVNINFMNYHITVLGEVARPGQYGIYNEKVSILDALGMAGDLTIYGIRKNVLITRENNGKLEFERLNLNSSDIFKSPYFYLQQNDVVYVEPSNVKTTASQNIPLYLSTLSTISAITTTVLYLYK